MKILLSILSFVALFININCNKLSNSTGESSLNFNNTIKEARFWLMLFNNDAEFLGPDTSISVYEFQLRVKKIKNSDTAIDIIFDYFNVKDSFDYHPVQTGVVGIGYKKIKAYRYLIFREMQFRDKNKKAENVEEFKNLIYHFQLDKNRNYPIWLIKEFYRLKYHIIL